MDDFDLLFDPRALGERPRALAWRPGHQELLGLWNEAGDGASWWLFRPDGSRVELARPDDFGAESASEIVSVAWSGDGRRLLVERLRSVALWDVETRELRVLTDGPVHSPALSPDGEHLAFVQGDELWTVAITDGARSGPILRRTFDAEPGVVFNATTDWVYWEEIWGRSAAGFWWSPDSRRIAFYHLDDREVPVQPLIDERPPHPAVTTQRYPKAGDPLPIAEIHVLDVASGEIVKLLDTAQEEGYLARVRWLPSGDRLGVERLNRAQNRLDLLLLGLDGSRREIASQESPTWVNLGHELRFLADGSFLWSHEQSGRRRIDLYRADGRSRRPLTPASWSVTSLDVLDEERGRIVFTAARGGEQHVFEGGLDGRDAVRRTQGAGYHQITADREFRVHTWSSASSPPRQAMVRHGESLGERPKELPRRDPSPEALALPAWEAFTVPGPGGVELPARMCRPPDFTPRKRYPVIMYHYGCPGSQVVYDAWTSARRSLWHQLMARRGYVVVESDNHASQHFNKLTGEDLFHRRFGEIELAAQTAVVKHLTARRWVHPERIGLWGWSGGGSATLYCLTHRPGLWAAGVAGAPVTDWTLYDAIWIERYLGHPRENAEGYAASSPIFAVEQLSDPLLLIHGTADNNVHAQNTTRLVQALIEAGKPFDLALYPNENHSLQNWAESGQRHVFARMARFFDQYLMGRGPEGKGR